MSKKGKRKKSFMEQHIELRKRMIKEGMTEEDIQKSFQILMRERGMTEEEIKAEIEAEKEVRTRQKEKLKKSLALYFRGYPWQLRAFGGILVMIGIIILLVCNYLIPCGCSWDYIIAGIVLIVVGLLIGVPEIIAVILGG